jgi:hypothetical protein
MGHQDVHWYAFLSSPEPWTQGKAGKPGSIVPLGTVHVFFFSFCTRMLY